MILFRLSCFTLLSVFYSYSFCTLQRINHDETNNGLKLCKRPSGFSTSTFEQSKYSEEFRTSASSSFTFDLVDGRIVKIQVNLNDEDLKNLNVDLKSIKKTSQQDSLFKTLAYFIIYQQGFENKAFLKNITKITKILAEKYLKKRSEIEVESYYQKEFNDLFMSTLQKKISILDDKIKSYIDSIRLYHGLTPENKSPDESIVCPLDFFEEGRVTLEEVLRNELEQNGLLSDEVEFLIEGCMEEIKKFFNSDHVILEGKDPSDEDMMKVYNKINQVLRSFYIYDFISIYKDWDED